MYICGWLLHNEYNKYRKTRPPLTPAESIYSVVGNMNVKFAHADHVGQVLTLNATSLSSPATMIL